MRVVSYVGVIIALEAVLIIGMYWLAAEHNVALPALLIMLGPFTVAFAAICIVITTTGWPHAGLILNLLSVGGVALVASFLGLWIGMSYSLSTWGS